MRLRTKVPVLGVALILAGISHIAAEERREQNPPGGDEFEHLMPHITQSCVVVRETPGIWPYRSFPYGPLGLEVRGAKTPAEADRIRNFFLGAVAGACGIPPDQVTGYFFCGPQCPANRRDHLLGQLPAIRSLARDFGDLERGKTDLNHPPRESLRVRQSSIPGITDRLRNDDYVIQAYQSSIVNPKCRTFGARFCCSQPNPGLTAGPIY